MTKKQRLITSSTLPAAGCSEESGAQVQEDLTWGEQRKQVWQASSYFHWTWNAAVSSQRVRQPPLQLNIQIQMFLLLVFTVVKSPLHLLQPVFHLVAATASRWGRCSHPLRRAHHVTSVFCPDKIVFFRESEADGRRRSHSNRLFSLEGAELRLMTPIKWDPW